MYLTGKSHVFFYGHKGIPTGNIRVRHNKELFKLNRKQALKLARYIIGNEIKVRKQSRYLYEDAVTPEELYKLVIEEMHE